MGIESLKFFYVKTILIVYELFERITDRNSSIKQMYL
jgi:hypothetical protein